MNVPRVTCKKLEPDGAGEIKPEAKLRLYEGGTVKARLDGAGMPSLVKYG